MASAEEQTPPPEQKAAVAELRMGEEYAAQLKVLIEEALRGTQVLAPMAGELIVDVLGSFSRGLAALGSGAPMVEAKQESVTTQVGSPGASDDRRSENSTKKRKIQTVARDRRTASRRRGDPYSWTRSISSTTEDGYTWRKYGQKDIFSAKYPRSYFRCTHKFDRGCQATRQVQRSEEDPSMFVITYMGEHTCRNASNLSQLSAISHPRAPCVINFGTNTACEGQATPFSCLPSSLKQECDEEVISSDHTPKTSPPLEHFASTELLDFEDFMPFMDKIAGPLSDHGEVTSLQSSTSSLDMLWSLDDITSIDGDELFQSLG